MKQNKSIKNEIMAKIKQDEIKMTSRWIFAAQKIGLKSGMALSILVLIFLLNAFLFFLKSNNLFIPDYHKFSIWQNVFYSLPYDLIFIIIVLGIILNFIVKKFDFSFKMPFILIFSGFTAFIVIWAGLLFSTNLNRQIQISLINLERHNFRVPYLTNFYVHRCGHCSFKTTSSKEAQNIIEACPFNNHSLLK